MDAANSSNVDRAVVVFDGFWTLHNERKDALIVTAVSYGTSRQSLEIVVPYRHAKAARGFAVHRSKFGALTGGTVDLRLLGEAFFRGVDAHEKGAKVWRGSLGREHVSCRRRLRLSVHGITRAIRVARAAP